MISSIKLDGLLTDPIDTSYITPYHFSVGTLAGERNNWRSGTTEGGGGGTRTRNPWWEADPRSAASTSFATPPTKDGGRETRTLRPWFLRPVAGDLLPPSGCPQGRGLTRGSGSCFSCCARLSDINNRRASPRKGGRSVPMAKKLKLSDTLVSLYGVPFEEALAGVLAVKPPENGETGQEKICQVHNRENKKGRFRAPERLHGILVSTSGSWVRSRSRPSAAG